MITQHAALKKETISEWNYYKHEGILNYSRGSVIFYCNKNTETSLIVKSKSRLQTFSAKPHPPTIVCYANWFYLVLWTDFVHLKSRSWACAYLKISTQCTEQVHIRISTNPTLNHSKATKIIDFLWSLKIPIC